MVKGHWEGKVRATLTRSPGKRWRRDPRPAGKARTKGGKRGRSGRATGSKRGRHRWCGQPRNVEERGNSNFNMTTEGHGNAERRGTREVHRKQRKGREHNTGNGTRIKGMGDKNEMQEVHYDVLKVRTKV